MGIFGIAKLKNKKQLIAAFDFFTMNTERLIRILSDPEFREYKNDIRMEILANQIGTLAIEYYIINSAPKPKQKLLKQKTKSPRDIKTPPLKKQQQGIQQISHYANYTCAKCNALIWKHINYCYRCGQRIKW